MKLDKVWLTSDTHFFHSRSLEIMPERRQGLGVSTVEEMNEELLRRYNNQVATDDLVVFLGDVVLGKRFETVPMIIPRLTGNKVLVLGNHDAGFHDPRPGKEEAAHNLYLNSGFKSVLRGMVSLQKILSDNGITEQLPKEINVCHFPYKGTPDHEGYDARYSHLMPEVSDVLLLCGHIHSRQHLLSTNMYHVGVDAEIHKYYPVKLIDILERIKHFV